MESNTNALEVFQQFAEDKFKDHFEELQTRYQNEALSSLELKQQAYAAHQNIYSQELNEKIEALLKNDDNPWLKGELENVKHTFITKLSLE